MCVCVCVVVCVDSLYGCVCVCFFNVFHSCYGMLAHVLLCSGWVHCAYVRVLTNSLSNFIVAIVFLAQSPGSVIELLAILALL